MGNRNKTRNKIWKRLVLTILLIQIITIKPIESYDFSGKTIIPFCTHGGSGLGRTVEDIKKICPNAEVENAIAFYGNCVNTSKQEVKDWIKRCE